MRGIPRSPVNSPHKGQWRGALMFSSICVWINGWVNNRKAGDLRRYRSHYDIIEILTNERVHTTSPSTIITLMSAACQLFPWLPWRWKIVCLPERLTMKSPMSSPYMWYRKWTQISPRDVMPGVSNLHGQKHVAILTHWGMNELTNILKMRFLYACSLMKAFWFRLQFPWNLFIWVQLALSYHWYK